VAVILVDPAVLHESSGPLLEVVRASGIDFPPKLFAVLALVAISNTALINMIMASRLLYGMANERIVPSVLGRVHKGRRTPYVAIAFTVLVSAALIAIGTVRNLAETTVLLLLLVFAVVNIALLVVRRRRPAEDGHFRAPSWTPVLGAALSLLLASPLTGRAPAVYAVAGVLVGIGVALWFVNRLIIGRHTSQPESDR
jgi:amino acid transporter